MDQSRWAPKQQQQQEEKTSESWPTSSLSASAPSFAPAPAPASPSEVEVDSFAQTGAAGNNLFDDVVPAEESMRVRSDDDLFSDDFTPVAQPVVEIPTPTPTRAPSSGSGGRGDGAKQGTARGSIGRGNRASNQAPGSGQTPSTSMSHSPRSAELQQLPDALDKAPTAPRKEPIVTAVRGDRHATGGVRKPKLTEDELVAKMARISIHNAELSAAHARSEADAASFAQREQQASQKQKVERRDRQQMMGEREKNRMRKLKGMEGREWDAVKREDEFERGGKFDKSGGFAGDQQGYSDGGEYLYREPKQGKSAGGGGGGGKVGVQGAPAREEFPALPPAPTGAAQRTAQPDRTSELQSWADQVESSDA
ncbi:hypothetical protein LTR08_007206 [Meristemomyces frigidus]|nr:hypothetical protein LTR08_007206 [Meristemomyces frigidus]